MHTHYRIQIALRVAALAVTAVAAAYVLYGPGWGGLAVGLGAALVVQSVWLVQYHEKMARDLTRFLESVRYADFSQGYLAEGRGSLFEELRDAFTEVTDAFRSIRAEKEKQVQYLERVVRHVDVALIGYRPDGRIEVMNRAARRLLGTGLVRKVETLEDISSGLVHALRTLKSGEQVMITLDLPDQPTLQLTVSVSRFQLQGTAHAIASLHDLRNELEEKEMEAWQQLTRVLTHEIMNSVAPIASLAGTVQRRMEANGAALSENSEAVTDVQEAAETIERRSRGLIHFVDAYRSFTDIRSPTLELLAVRDLFASVKRLLRTAIDERGLDLTVEVHPETLSITADPELIEQVLINLILNAIEAVEDQPSPHICLHAHIDRRSRPVVQVTDNGPGIPPDVQEKMFVPFFTTKAQGSGIGLSLSRQIMRVHGGTASVQSEPGATTVTLRF